MKLSVIGVPATQGSKRAFPIRRKNGQIGVAVTESGGETHRAWKGLIIDAFMAKYGTCAASDAGYEEPMGGPVIVDFTFYLPRPKSAPKSRVFPDRKPDSLKLARLVEDALSLMAYRDDAQIVTHSIRKRYAIGRPPGVEIAIRPASEADLTAEGTR